MRSSVTTYLANCDNISYNLRQNIPQWPAKIADMSIKNIKNSKYIKDGKNVDDSIKNIKDSK